MFGFHKGKKISSLRFATVIKQAGHCSINLQVMTALVANKRIATGQVSGLSVTQEGIASQGLPLPNSVDVWGVLLRSKTLHTYDNTNTEIMQRHTNSPVCDFNSRV
jgi:hypothetical protein